MREADGHGAWDFSPSIHFIQSIIRSEGDNGSIGHDHYCQERQDRSWKLYSDEVELADLEKGIDSHGLGDFTGLWKFLGVPAEQNVGDKPSEEEHTVVKGVRWKDEIDGADLADEDEFDDDKRLVGLTKTQRKKVRRKERRAELVGTLNAGKFGPVPSSSDNDSDDGRKSKLLDRKTIIHKLLDRPLPDRRTSSGTLDRANVTLSFNERWPVAKPCASHVSHKSAEEILLAVAAAKKAKLLGLIKERFIEDRQYLNDFNILSHLSPSAPCTTDGVHIFIDASNIMIGFHDALKLSRNQPISARIRRQPISFHALSLILSRGRPTAKRVVVGSDKFPEMAEAKLIGYETSILDRVHKAKELTPRQKRYANGSGNGTQSAGSGSESAAATAAQFAPEKWVEQAVDEILHLKMMESVVDVAQPAIMVLATGDAAEAEYSGGFLKMVERALNKGWKIELASFRHNTSGAYKKRDFRQKWGDKFKIIELDDFVESLIA